jgi:hypothetical protein
MRKAQMTRNQLLNQAQQNRRKAIENRLSKKGICPYEHSYKKFMKEASNG